MPKTYTNLLKAFTIEQDTKTATIAIDGVIGDMGFLEDEPNTRAAFKETINAIRQVGQEVETIRVEINSLGGVVSDALGIYDALKEAPARVETILYGLSASAATVIAQAGDVRYQSANSLQLVHDARTYFYGNKAVLLRELDDLEKVNERLVNIYMKNVKISREEFIAHLEKDVYMSPEEALEMGLIDEIYEADSSSRMAAFNLPATDVLNRLGLPPVTKFAAIERPDDQPEQERHTDNHDAVTDHQSRARAKAHILTSKLKIKGIDHV